MYVAIVLNYSVSTGNKIINSDLNLKKTQKHNIAFFSVISMTIEHVAEFFMKNLYQEENGKISYQQMKLLGLFK